MSVILLSTVILLVFVFFFFKQKTAYELRISDWSSDVCSSDLTGAAHPLPPGRDRDRQPVRRGFHRPLARRTGRRELPRPAGAAVPADARDAAAGDRRSTRLNSSH